MEWIAVPMYRLNNGQVEHVKFMAKLAYKFWGYHWIWQNCYKYPREWWTHGKIYIPVPGGEIEITLYWHIRHGKGLQNSGGVNFKYIVGISWMYLTPEYVDFMVHLVYFACWTQSAIRKAILGMPDHRYCQLETGHLGVLSLQLLALRAVRNGRKSSRGSGATQGATGGLGERHNGRNYCRGKKALSQGVIGPSFSILCSKTYQ
ncbi:Vif protein [Simian immunodeficiency virus - olc]|uniref:Virion infectivity factor n=1 Tax=Simian immunodeficiency virus - olc TaxID=538563 RepID=B7UES2_SIV|nr:Vif protein [Simian immunodeficiency virus - olc]